MTKRPFAFAGISLLASQAVALFCEVDIKITLLVLLLLVIAYLFLRRSGRTAVMICLICSAAALLGNLIYTGVVMTPARVLDGETVHISGEVIREPDESESRYYYVIETSRVDFAGAPQKMKLRLSSKNSLEIEYGDTISADVSFIMFGKLERYSQLSFAADGISAAAFISPHAEYSVDRGGMSIGKRVIELRSGLREIMHRALPDDVAALSAAVLLGDKSELSSATISDFRICGMSHILAVSGLHLSIIASFALYLLHRLGLDRRKAALVCIPVILFYMSLTGFSSSVTRAGIMSIIALTAAVVNRDYDAPSALGAALCVMCLANPCAAGDAGLLLSASCTAGLVTVMPVIAKQEGYGRLVKGKGLLASVRRFIVSSAAVSAVSSLCALPITVIVFEEMSLISVPANMLCVAAASFMLTSLCVMCVVGLLPFVGTALSLLIGAVVCVPGKYLLYAASLLAEIPGASRSAGEHYVPVLLVLSGVILIAWYFLFRSKPDRKRMLVLAVAVIMQMTMTALCVDTVLAGNEAALTVYNLDGGLGVAVKSGGNCVVIGCGGDEYLAFEMTHDIRRLSGGNIDAMFFADDDEYNASYAAQMVEHLEPDAVFLPPYGSQSELIAGRASGAGSQVYDVSQGECRTGDIEVSGFSDSNGDVWINVLAGKMRVLICPPHGDCALLPEYMYRPDCAIVADGRNAGIASLGATVVIVCADREESAVVEKQLYARGIDNVLSPSFEGDLRIYTESTGVSVEVLK